MANRRALITGITGQDGSYLAELLLSKGYSVHGLFRPEEDAGRLPQTALANIQASRGLLENYEEVAAAIRDASPDECYHLAAQTFIAGEENATIQTNILGSQHVMCALRQYAPACRMFLAGSSEMFGDVDHSPQTEATPMRPRNVYGISKVAACMLMQHYRETCGLHFSCGILYNHESPRRGEHFVTRKITQAATRIKAGAQDKLRLGNLDAVRDWGAARDYVEAMWRMLQEPAPDDYVIATGAGRTVRDFLDTAFGCLELDWRDYVVIDEQYYRPAEKHPLIGDPSKARKRLGWSPKLDFVTLVREMIDSERAYSSPDAL